jgi:hypothetical protein
VPTPMLEISRCWPAISLVLLDLFYVTSCNITFLEYAENVWEHVIGLEHWNILRIGDRSTFVHLR